MSHHHHQSDQIDNNNKSLDGIYYLVGLLSGLITGAIVDKGFIWVPIGGVLGLLTAAFFLNVLVKGREDI